MCNMEEFYNDNNLSNLSKSLIVDTLEHSIIKKIYMLNSVFVIEFSNGHILNIFRPKFINNTTEPLLHTCNKDLELFDGSFFIGMGYGMGTIDIETTRGTLSIKSLESSGKFGNFTMLLRGNYESSTTRKSRRGCGFLRGETL